jgi:hypothetical protein
MEEPPGPAAGARVGTASAAKSSPAAPPSGRAAGLLRFKRLKWVSFTHSCIYTALLLCAFVIGKPQPFTFVLGLSHGLLWIFMSLACIAAARLRIVSLRLAVAVAVLGGIGPFFGSYEFIREERMHANSEPAHSPSGDEIEPGGKM